MKKLFLFTLIFVNYSFASGRLHGDHLRDCVGQVLKHTTTGRLNLEVFDDKTWQEIQQRKELENAQATAATTIQRVWRGYLVRRELALLVEKLEQDLAMLKWVNSLFMQKL